MRRALILPALVPFLLACTIPVMRPMRTHEGPGVAAGLLFLRGAKRSGGCDNFQGCRTTGSAGGMSFLNFDARIGHRFTDWFGLTFGLYGPGFRNSKSTKWHALGVSYLQASFQNDYVSLAVGTEVGTRVIGGTAGLDVQPFGKLQGGWAGWDPSVSGYFRWLTPYSYRAARDVDPDEANARVPSWDAGATLRVGPVFFQYAYWRQTAGVIDYIIYETSTRAAAWHVFLVGLDANLDSLKAFFPSLRD
jgi:hypothetical protein